MELLLKKLKIPYDQNTKLPDDPAILLLGIYQKNNNNNNSKRYIHPKVHSNIIYNCHNMEANEQIKKLLYIYIFICGFDPWIRKIPWRRTWQPL